MKKCRSYPYCIVTGANVQKTIACQFTGCPGCFNPASWSFEIDQLISIDALVQKILSNSCNEGVAFSGGEPFWQASALVEVSRQVASSTALLTNDRDLSPM
jgi:organic radical activating enzyme